MEVSQEENDEDANGKEDEAEDLNSSQLSQASTHHDSSVLETSVLSTADEEVKNEDGTSRRVQKSRVSIVSLNRSC